MEKKRGKIMTKFVNFISNKHLEYVIQVLHYLVQAVIFFVVQLHKMEYEFSLFSEKTREVDENRREKSILATV